MKLTAKKLIKCITKSGRRSLVKELLEEELTRDALISGACKATAKGINDGVNKMTDKSKIGTLHTGLTCLHNSVGAVLKATDPLSEEGVKISDSETTTIVSEVRTATDVVLTEDTVAKLREYIISKVP